MGTILIQKPKATMPQLRKHHLSTENPMEDELLPSHIRGKSVHLKNPSLSSRWPTPPKDTHARPSYHSIRPPHPKKFLRMKKRA